MDKTSSFYSHEGKPIRCKAAICKKAGEPLVIEEIHVHPPQAYEVRIKIVCTTLCHTDLAFSKYDSVIYFYLTKTRRYTTFFFAWESPYI